MIIIDFGTNINNDSLQLGDIAYYVPDPSVNTGTGIDGFNQSTDAPIFIGTITDIFDNQTPPQSIGDPTFNGIIFSIEVFDEVVTPPLGAFIMFVKNPQINLSGLVGYFAEAKIMNNSKEKAEMYSIGSEITISSK